ncbi:hypothetical protein LAZ67_15002178 [Cordylochernes scorpioides]|uniref:ABC transmembrane type-1 domain-containing protein n=1 Tax=Cordylochernes scorpioides TaxID=51811 RepID=A0ABY6L9G0_9ARAC|nr:hypothetical protein LAZ67_15002178 [Cordylochernes scorpioides]
MIIMRPLLGLTKIGLLLAFLSSDLPPWRGYIYAGAMLMSAMLESLLNNQYLFHIQQTAMRARTCMLSAIFKKNLRMSPSSRQQNTTGQAVNLMALDSMKVTEWLAVSHDVWALPLRVIISLVLLWGKLGPASLGGLAIIALMVPFNATVTLRMRRLQVSTTPLPVTFLLPLRLLDDLFGHWLLSCPMKSLRCLYAFLSQQQQLPLSWVCKAAVLGPCLFSAKLWPMLGYSSLENGCRFQMGAISMLVTLDQNLVEYSKGPWGTVGRPMVSSSFEEKSVKRIENEAVKLPPTEFNRNSKETVRQFMSGNSARKLMNPRPPYSRSFDRGDLVMLAVPKTEGYSNVYGPFRVEARVSDVNFRLKVMGIKDQRMKMITEVLTGIQTIKLAAWELSFHKMIRTIRGKELFILRKAIYLGMALVFSFVSAPFLVGLASFGTYILMDPSNVLDANKAFVALSLFNILRPAMVTFPQLITATIMVSTNPISNPCFLKEGTCFGVISNYMFLIVWTNLC